MLCLITTNQQIGAQLPMNNLRFVRRHGRDQMLKSGDKTKVGGGNIINNMNKLCLTQKVNWSIFWSLNWTHLVVVDTAG